MAFNHIHFGNSTPYANRLRSALTMMEKGDDELADVRDLMIQMRDGDGTQDIHYAELTARFGFATDAKARAACEELDSAY